MCEDGCLPDTLGGLKQTSLHECRSPLIGTVLFKEGSGTNKSRHTELSCPLLLFSAVGALRAAHVSRVHSTAQPVLILRSTVSWGAAFQNSVL